MFKIHVKCYQDTDKIILRDSIRLFPILNIIKPFDQGCCSGSCAEVYSSYFLVS